MRDGLPPARPGVPNIKPNINGLATSDVVNRLMFAVNGAEAVSFVYPPLL